MFKTYDNDIDGITNKLGFSKRSFAEWGEQVSNAFTESEGKMNKFKNTLSAVFVPQKDTTKLIGDFQAFKDLMLETGLSAEELSKEVGGVDSRIVSYAKSGEVGKLTTDGFKKSIGNLSLGAKAGQVALKGLALVGNALAMAFASWVATEIISWLNDLAHAEENARKRSEELTSSYETEKKDIDDSIAKYKELSEKLNDTSLSTSEVKSIKEQLLSVQDQLNEKYGAEATQIDLVNGKYDEQIEKLDKLSKKKAGDYVAENYNDIKADQKYVSEKVNLNKSLGFKGSQARPNDYSNAGFDLKKYLDRYDKLDAKVVNPDSQYGMTGNVNLITSGTRQEIYDQITALFNDLSNDFGNSNEGVNAFKSALNNILKSSFDTNELAAANDRIKKYTQAEILSNDNTSVSYNNLVDAVDNYNTALSSGKGIDDARKKLVEAKKAAEESTNEISNSGKVLQDVYNSLSGEAPIGFQIEIGKNVDEDLQKSYEDTINRFKSSEESSLNELTKKYDEAIAKRKELYSGENYVGNVDINNRPVVINDDDSYSTTSTAFQEKWVGDEENGHYIIAHFTPILPDGTVLDDETLNDYIDRILNSDNPMEADKVENGGYGILYKVDTEINGQEINDDNLEDAFGIADAWDVDMHNLQNEIYASEAEIKAQIEKFDNGINGSQKIKNFFDKNGINTTEKIKEFNDLYATTEQAKRGIYDADIAIQTWNEHKNSSTTSNYAADFKTLNDSLSTLTENAELLSKVNKEISESGRVSAENLKKINEAFPKDKYPWMTKALYDYQLGLISTTELFENLEQAYNIDSNKYAENTKSKIEHDKDYYSMLKELYPNLFDNLRNLYQEDFGNWKNLAEAKKGVELKLISEIGSAWKAYYNVFQTEDGSYDYTDIGFKVDYGADTADEDEARELENAAMNKYKADAKKFVDGMNEALAEINKLYPDITAPSWQELSPDTSKSSSKDSTDAWKEEAEKQIKLLDHYHNMGYLSDEQYYKALNELNEKYYAGQEKYLDDYRSYAEKIYSGLKQAYSDMLNKQKDYMGQAINAVTGYLDDQIDALNDQKDAVEDEYNARIEALESEQNLLDEQKDAIEEQKNAIQEQIDAIDKANEARQKAIDLQKKQYELNRAMNQNTNKVYVNGQMVWQTDDSAITDARNDLEDAKAQDATDKLQDQIDELDKASEALDKQKDALQNQIDSLNDELDKITEGIEKQIDELQKYKDRWAEIPDQFTYVQNQMIASMMLGQDWQQKALSMNEDMLYTFGTSYNNIQGQLQLVTDASAQDIVNMAQLSGEQLGILAAQADESLTEMGGSIQGQSEISEEALNQLMLAGTDSLSTLASKVGESSQSVCTSIGDIISKASDAITTLNQLSELQDKMDFAPIYSGVTVTAMRNGGVVEVETARKGTVTGSHRSKIAKSLGEDHLVVAREGEGFVPPEQVKDVQDSVKAVNKFADLLIPAEPKFKFDNFDVGQTVMSSNLIKQPGLDFNGVSNTTSQNNTIKIESGAIVLNEVTKPDVVGEAIIKELPNYVTRKLNQR